MNRPSRTGSPKHGLAACGRERHASRGGLDQTELRRLVANGLSIRAIAAALGCSPTTVRHWLTEYGLRTDTSRRRAADDGSGRFTAQCREHGLTAFVRRKGGGSRCVKCRSEAVSRHRRRLKETLVADAGGGCVLCGYDRCISALDFHHLVPNEKDFEISYRGLTRSLAKVRAEARKCVLLCSNCHVEVEGGVAVLDPALRARIQCRPLASESSPGLRDPG
jgi:predicted transcriptional regulator